MDDQEEFIYIGMPNLMGTIVYQVLQTSPAEMSITDPSGFALLLPLRRLRASMPMYSLLH